MLSCLRAKFQRFKGFEIFFESGGSSEKARIREFKSGVRIRGFESTSSKSEISSEKTQTTRINEFKSV